MLIRSGSTDRAVSWGWWWFQISTNKLRICKKVSEVFESISLHKALVVVGSGQYLYISLRLVKRASRKRGMRVRHLVSCQKSVYKTRSHNGRADDLYTKKPRWFRNPKVSEPSVALLGREESLGIISRVIQSFKNVTQANNIPFHLKQQYAKYTKIRNWWTI